MIRLAVSFFLELEKTVVKYFLNIKCIKIIHIYLSYGVLECVNVAHDEIELFVR